MARNRVIYQSEALYVSENIDSTTAAKHKQLERVQSANYNFSINRQDVNEFGQLARVDSIIMDAPTVGLDFSYYLTDGVNEQALGFYVKHGSNDEGQFASGHMVSSSGKNFYIATVDEGTDATTVGGNGVKSIIGIGNAFLSDYTLDLSIGSLPTVSVSMECANINSTVDASISGDAEEFSGVSSPAVDMTDGSPLTAPVILPDANTGVSAVVALRPGDVTVNISALDGRTISDIASTTTEDSVHIQSASLSVPLGRSPLQRLGTRFSFARTVDFPVNATLSVSAIMNEVTAANLATIINDQTESDVSLTIKDPVDGVTDRMVYTLKGCKIDSESFSSSIGSNKTVDLTFSTQIGGLGDANNGVFVTASNATAPFGS